MVGRFDADLVSTETLAAKQREEKVNSREARVRREEPCISNSPAFGAQAARWRLWA